MQVGGEFYADESWLLERSAAESGGALFLSGGSACLELIAALLVRRGFRRILLPAYLCPVIPAALARAGLACAFYRVAADLSIDLPDAARQARKGDAFLYINYFGFPHSLAARDFFGQLRADGIPLIADNAQCGPDLDSEADFSFNSLRKFVPYDGGYLRAAEADLRALAELLPAPRPDSPRLAAVRAYRSRLGAYLRGDGGAAEHRALVALYNQAEQAYTREPAAAGDPLERAAIQRLDWARIRRVRRENYTYLLELLRSVPGVRPALPTLPEAVMPLGLPVFLEGVPRGRVLDILGRAGIGATVHWNPTLPGAPWARRMLTLPIDQRAGRKEMETLALQLVRAVETAKEK